MTRLYFQSFLLCSFATVDTISTALTRLWRSLASELGLANPDRHLEALLTCGTQGPEIPKAEKLVCDEKYLGSYSENYLYNGTWALDRGRLVRV